MDMKYLVTLSTLFFLIADCLSGCFDIGFQNCPPVADATPKPQGALGISINSLLRPATGVYSHPCSDTPHWHIPVPVLPVTDEILRALVQIPIMHPYSDGQTGRDVKHWKDYFNIERKNTFLERSHFSSLLLPGHRRKFGLFF